MGFDLQSLDTILESRVRVGVLALLAQGDAVEFTYLRDKLGVTDGNLATHLRRLEESKYVGVKKSFVGRRPQTAYVITAAGRKALERHVAVLSEALKKQKGA